MMSPVEADAIVLLQTVALGGVGLFSLTWLHVFFIRWIALLFEVRARVNLARGRFNRVFAEFFLSVTCLAFAHLAAIVLWATALLLLGVVTDPATAALFSGSCYTTVGIVSDILPAAWKLLPIFISMSGLFAFSLSTMTMLSMAPLSRRAWLDKHARHIRAILAANKIDGIHEFELSAADVDGPSGAE